MARAARVLGVLVVVLLAALPSHAFRMIQNNNTGLVTAGDLVSCNDPGGFVHWSTPGITWFHNTSGQGAGKAAALQSAMSSWTAVSGASHTLSYGGTTTAGWSVDGSNTLVWAFGNGCSGTCLALTGLVLQSGQVITETDVTFNAGVNWTTHGAQYDTESVAAHEIGHALGIHHSNVGGGSLPTMNATYFGSGGRTLEHDDREALRCAETNYPFGGGPLGTPVAMSPSGTVTDPMPTFDWSSVSGAQRYRLSVQTLSGSYYYLPEPLPTTTSYTPSTPLQQGDCYNWWVRAERLNGDVGPWSAKKTVCVAGPPLGQPSSIAPSGTVNGTTPTFSWSSVNGAQRYRLSVQTLSGTYYYLPEPLPTGTSFTPTQALVAGACYNWWVRAERLNGDVGPWSAKSTVCVSSPPLGTPTNLSPSGSITDTTPVFSWSAVAGAVYYRLNVQTSTGTYYYVPEPTPSGTSFTPSTPLQTSACYNWWVRAERAIGDYGPWSSMKTVCTVPSGPGGGGKEDKQ